MAKTKEEIPDRRSPGPKNRRTVIPSTFQISRPVSPMRQILDEAEGTTTRPSIVNTPPRPSTDSNESAELIDFININNNLSNNTHAHTRASRASIDTTPPTVSRPSRDYKVKPSPYTGIAPSRDFMRVANSITREAVPGGLFAGKAKQLYDYLYSKTRGAMIPKMSVRLTKRELMRGADINTEVTLRSNLNRLRGIGLVETLEIRGVHGGNEYTIYIPDEILTGSRPSRDSRYSISPQKIETLEGLENRGAMVGINLEIEDGLPVANTFLKTTNDDDDDGTGLLGFVKEIEKAALELAQGSLPITEQERAKWIECGKTLAEEIHKIGMRTSTVSSVPALLNAHLRRCFGRQQRPPAGGGKERVPGPVEPRERLKRIIREIRGLHVGDSGYKREELITDVRYRAERAGLRVDDTLIEEMVGPDPLGADQ